MVTVYNIRKIKSELQRLNGELKSHEKTSIAAAEHCSTNTVRTYLTGKFVVPALADAIVKRGNQIIKNRKDDVQDIQVDKPCN